MPVTLPETIVRRRCAALIPYARNARTHSDQQVAQIAASIREFGFTNPVLIDEEDGITAVRASRGKVIRAEPVAALYEQRRIHHVGAFPTLEDQMCQFAPDFDRLITRDAPDLP